MRNILICAILLASAVGFKGCATPVPTQSADILYSSHKPYTRWWWFAAEIDTLDVKYQLDWLKENNFGGVEIAWIYPMFGDADTPRPEWLSPGWAAAVEYAKRYADRIGLGVDYTYGTLWPFNDRFMPDSDGSKSYFDTVSPMKRTITWDHPEPARILNHLDREAFYRYAERMDRGLKDAYKGSPSGIFVDSWEVNTQFLWTEGFGERFREMHGYDLEPIIDNLYLPGYEDILYDYMKVLSLYAMYDFYEPFTLQAHKNGAFSRAQCGGSPTDLLTAFSLVDIPETEAILFEPNFSRIPASAAAIAGKQAVSSETFTCIYGWTGWGPDGRGQSPYQKKEQVGDMKLIADALFANGTNQIFWHGMPYNRRGDTTNFFYTTVHVGPDCHFRDQLKDFNLYMSTVSRYMRMGRTYSDAAVYIPMEDAWRKGELPDSLRQPGCRWEYELRYIFTPEELKGRNPLWVNNHFLSTAQWRNGKLQCGESVFSSLTVDVDYMDIEALRNLLRLAREGLPVWLPKDPAQPGRNKSSDYAGLLAELKALPNVSPDVSVIPGKPLVEGDDLPDYWCREDNGVYYLFFANPASQGLKYYLEYMQAFRDEGSRRDIVVNANGRSRQVTLDFKPNESLLMKIDRKGKVHFIDLGFVPQVIR
ncbi:MAG: hypothetical protein LUE26_10370 [Alistipes sp.]|nr:hypothetical protein [Alistipes sp.]